MLGVDRRFTLAAICILLSACKPGSPPPATPSTAPDSNQPVTSGPPVSPSVAPYAGATDLIPVGAGPRGVAYHAGSIWVASTIADLIQRVDPLTNTVSAEVHPGQRPVTLVTIGGALWASVLNGDASDDDELVQIDAGTNTVEMRIKIPVFHNIAAGAGFIWVVDGLGQLRRVDPLTGAVTKVADAGPNTVAIAADETAVWGIRGDEVVWRLPVSGGEFAETPLGLAVPGRSRVAVGAGAVWVAVPGSVQALEPASLDALAHLELPGMELVNDLYVTEADVWLSANVTDAALGLDGGSVLRLDPATLEVLATYRLGPESSGVVPAEGSLWAVDQRDNTLARFPLAD